jgi:hypothetical protein
VPQLGKRSPSIAHLQGPRCLFRVAFSGLPFPGCLFRVAFSRLPFPGCLFRVAFSGLPFPGCLFRAAFSGLPFPGCLFRTAFSELPFGRGGGSDDPPGSRCSSCNKVVLELQRYDFGSSSVPRRCHYRWALVPLSLAATLTLDRWEDCPAIVTAPERRWPEHLGTKGPPCVICPLPALGLRCLQPA